MTDRYTKFVLSVIAIVLAVIAFQNSMQPAQAAAQNCGSGPTAPCYVWISNQPIEVVGF